jgi:hypothetical protein
MIENFIHFESVNSDPEAVVLACTAVHMILIRLQQYRKVEFSRHICIDDQ